MITAAVSTVNAGEVSMAAVEVSTVNAGEVSMAAVEDWTQPLESEELLSLNSFPGNI